MANSKRKKTSGYFVTVGTGEKIQYNSNPTRSKPKVTETQKQAAEARVQQYRSAAKENASTQSGLSKPAKITSDVSGEAWTRATPSQTTLTQDQQKKHTEIQLKTYQTQLDQANRDAYDWGIREEQEFLGGFVPQDVLDRTNKSKYKSSAEAKQAAQVLGQQKTSLLNQNYENRSQAILKTVNADKNASSALKTAQGLEDLQRKIRYELEWSSAEGIDRSSAETRKLGRQYGLTEAECKNIWSMQAAITKKLKQAKAAVEKTGVSYDDAYEYLRRQELSQEAASKKTALEKELDDNGLEMAKHTGLSVLANMGKGVDYVAGIAGNWGHNDERNLDTYRPMNSDAMSATNYVNTVRGKVGSEIQEDATAGLKKLGASEGVAQFGGEASKFLYDTGMSIVDNAAQMAVAGVAGAGTAGTSAIVSGFMGTGAAADQMKNILDNGGTNDQAMVGGFAAGVAEALFEKVSIDALLAPKNVTNFKSWAKEALKQGGVEASEEVCTELANMFTDALIRGQDSDFQRAIAYYQTEEGGGLSLAEAKKKAYLDAIGQVALAGLGGFISGGVMQGVKGGVGLGNYNSTLKKVGQAVKDSTGNTQNTSHIAEIQKGLAAADGSKARQLAEQAQKELDSKKTVSSKLLGKLAVENQNELRDAMKAASPEAAAKARTELISTGNVSTATMAELRASAKVSPAASAQVQQTEAQAQVTRAENPGSTVLDAATTLFTQQGMLLKTAQKKAQIVQDLIAGKDVDADRIKELEPTNPKARALFTQLTGVQFPEGKLSIEQLYNLYRSAHDVAVQAQVQAQVQAETEVENTVPVDSAEGREAFPGVNRVLDNSGQETPVNQMSEKQILEQAKTVRETANPEADARAAQALAQMRGEIAPDGNALLSFKEFSDFIKQQNPKATREETARLYDQYLKDNQTVEFRGQRLSHMQFMDMVRHAPRGSELTEAEAESLWAAEVDRQRGAGEEKYSVSESQRTKESEMNAAAEQARRAENAATAKWMQDVLKPIGVQQVIVEYGTMGDNENAYIDSDGILHFNGDRMSGANAMIWTLGHELVHHAEFRTGETGNVSEDIIDAFSKLNKAGALSGVAKTWMDNVDGRVSEIKKTYQDHEASLENGDPDKVTDAYCREELAGDLMRIAFTEDNLLMRLAGEKPSLLIRSKEALARLKAQMFGNEQIRATVDARKALDEMEKRFEKALKTSEARAIRNEPGAFTDSDGNLIVENDGKGSSRLSLSTYEESGKEILRTWLDDAVDNKQLSREDADDILNSLDTIYQVCKDYKDQYAPFSAWSDAKVVTDSNGNPVFSVVKANGEYSMNLDFSLVCKKRRTLDAVLNEMVRRGLADNVNMGQENIVRINDIIRKYGFEVACSLCFVDAKRFRQAKVADDFVKMYNDQVNSLIPKGSDLKASYFNFGGNSLIDNTGRGIESLSDTDLDFTKVDKILKTKGERTVEYKIAKHLKENAADRRLCARSDFLSTRGVNVVKKENPAVMSLFNSKKGSGGPKSAESDVQYLNEILASKTFNPEKAYAVGGVRIQSFSDFVPRMVFDYVQMFADMSAKKLPGHAYTKEELFVKMFGLTGLKINMSLIPKVVDGGVAAGLDADGNYVWADESFDYDIALEIQSADGYSKNCGTIAVGVSDEHIRKLLADPNIRMVIPYHKSGLNPEVARMNKIDQFTDYTDSQNTRHKNGNKLDKDNAADKKLLAEETNFNQRLHEMGENGDPQAVVEEYVKWCEDNDLLPKFDQFVYKKIGDMFVEEDGHKVVDENYYKLIEDFTVYDGGAYSPQTAVKMTFPTEDSAFGSMSELIKRGLEEDAILEGMRSEKVGHIVDEIAQAMQSDEWKGAAKEPGKKRSRKRYSVRVTPTDTYTLPNGEEVNALDYLNSLKEEGVDFIYTYKSMSYWGKDENGNAILRSPMAEFTEKNKNSISGAYIVSNDKSKLNWYKSEEDPSKLYIKVKENGKKSPSYIPMKGNEHLVAPDWSNLYYPLIKKNELTGQLENPTYARYNPYEHSSNKAINDQFDAGYRRPNLVTVKMKVPLSEQAIQYRADFSKDPTGWTGWKSGKVAGKISQQKPDWSRDVYLSRYSAPVEIMPNSWVAQQYKEYLEGTDVEVPDAVVSADLLSELRKIGVPIKETGKLKALEKSKPESYAELERLMSDLKAEQTVGEKRYSITSEEESALRKYKSSDSYKVNAALRGERAWTPELESLRDNLDSAIPKLPVYTGKAFRVLEFDSFGDGAENLKKFADQFTIGKLTKQDGYLSASKTKNGNRVAKSTHKAYIILKATSAHEMDGYGINTKDELIFARGTSFRVDHKMTLADGSLAMQWSEVAEDNDGRGDQETDSGVPGSRGYSMANEGGGGTYSPSFSRGPEGVPSDSQRSVRSGDPGGPVSEGQKRYSITPEFEQWYRSMFDNPADADASIGKATRYNELMQKYGAMDEANNAVRETPVPVKSTEKKAVSETVRTIMGAEATPNSRIPTIVDAVADGKLSHVPTANNVYSRRAAGTLRREGWAKTLRDWTAEVRSGKSSPDLVAMGAVLLNNAGNSNATGTEYLDILSDYVELMSRNGKSLQMGNLFKTLSPEGRLYMAEKIAKNINEKIRERKGKKTKAAADTALDDIIEVRDTALQTIKDIFDALSEDRNKTSHGVPVEDWMKEIGNRLAGQISSNMADKVQRQRPITKVIQEDLLKFAESYALPKGNNLGVERRASDRVADFFNNRDAYVEAWNQARSELRNRYKDDPEKLDALEEFLNGTLGYNGTGSDAVMMRAVAEFALDGDTKARDIVMRAKMGDRKALEARVFNALNSKVQATGSDADILRDAVSRFVSNTLADSGIDSENALANSVKSAMKDIGVKMSDIIRQGAESKEAVANRIAEMLVKEYKVSQEGAAEAARIVVDKFTEMTAEAAQAKLESMFKARPTRAERSLLLRFDELVNLGAFTSDQFNHLAAQKIFGVDVQIDPTLIDEYRAAKTDKARDEVLDKITTNIAEQIPATKMEKFTALRYLNMLGNLKTQIRNVVGNLAYQPVRMIKDQVGAAIETAAQGLGMDIERTKAFGRDMETYKFGLKDFEEVRQIIMGGGKYNDNARFSQDIENKRRIFKSALLEKYRVLTNEAMDIGDAVFSKMAYADALSGYMKANGTTWSKASEELRDKARVYAIQQAAEATYRDNNAFSDAISKMRIQNADTWAKRAINTIGEGLMPFRKTPANILVRTVEYSPVGLALSAINAGRAKAGADVTATQVIDQLAKGLTGSALMVLGYALANLGVLRGGDDDEEKKAEFDDLLGHQAYAIELGGHSITLDWLAPEAVPLFLGAQVSKATEDGAMSPGDVMRTLASIPDPILEMSMLQGLNDALKNASSYGDDQALVRFTGNALWSYLTQGLTSTLMGQAVRAVNNTRMTTYVDKNSDMPSGMQSALGKFTAKLPLPNALKYNQIPYIDAWGRMEQNADNAALNFVFQFANPAYVSKVEVSDTESELERLYGATKNTSVLPQRAPKKFSLDGQVVNLTADQYVVFASDVGRTSYNTVTDLTGSKLYQNLSDADKARAVENVYDYAKQTAKENLVGYKVDNWVKEAEASGDPALYCAIKAATYNIEGIPDPKDPGKSISNSKGLQVMEVIYKMPGLTEKQKQTYIELFVGKSIQGYSESKVKRELEKMRRKSAK